MKEVLFLSAGYPKTTCLRIVLQEGMTTGSVVQEEQASKNTRRQLCVLEVIFINRHHIACHDVVI